MENTIPTPKTDRDDLRFALATISLQLAAFSLIADQVEAGKSVAHIPVLRAAVSTTQEWLCTALGRLSSREEAEKDR